MWLPPCLPVCLSLAYVMPLLSRCPRISATAVYPDFSYTRTTAMSPPPPTPYSNVEKRAVEGHDHAKKGRRQLRQLRRPLPPVPARKPAGRDGSRFSAGGVEGGTGRASPPLSIDGNRLKGDCGGGGGDRAAFVTSPPSVTFLSPPPSRGRGHGYLELQVPRT